MISFNVSLNTEQFDLFRDAILHKYPGVEFQFIHQMNRIAFHAINGHTMPCDAQEAALSVLSKMELPTVREVNYDIPKPRKPVREQIHRGQVRVEQRVGVGR